MHCEWNDQKNHQNLRKHGIRFETAALAFDDPYAVTQRDESSEEEERCITLGAIDPGAILVVVHTWMAVEGEDVTRTSLPGPRSRTKGELMRKLTKEQKKISPPSRP